MNAITQTPASKGQLRQIENLLRDAFESEIKKINPDKNAVQLALENANFAEQLRTALQASFSSYLVTDQYQDEEVSSTHRYFSRYEKPLSLTEQIELLRTRDMRFKHAAVPDPIGLHAGSEGAFVAPNFWKQQSLLTGTYHAETLYLLKQFGIEVDQESLGKRKLLQSAQSKAACKKLSQDQGHPDFLVFPASFGLAHRGRSARRASQVMNQQNQFPLGTLVAGSMLLTHPNRLQHFVDLWVICAGDTLSTTESDGIFHQVPNFRFHPRNGVYLSKIRNDQAQPFNSSVSCVLP